MKILNLVILFYISQSVIAGEFLIKDEVRVIDVNVSPWSGRTTWMFDGVGPGNWESPDNYYTGTFYVRYEIVSQPTNRACQAQMVIWQDWHDDYSFWREQASARTTLYGQGYVATVSSSPSTWWKYNDIPLEFSRPSDFYKLGIVIWSDNPLGRISAQLGPDNPEVNVYDEIWADRYDWFPMSLRVTIVAVSQGSTFSGWDSYLGGGGDPGIQPAYSIDYINERTREDVLPQHEFSYNNATWYDGWGGKIDLSPGSTLYFRDKNDQAMTQTLIVDSRPAAPDFSIDYLNERTNTAVSPDFLFSSSSDMSGSASGTGNYLTVIPGTDMYFRQIASSTHFASAVQSLVVPSRPATPSFSIDFENERTSGIISSGIHYATSSDMSGFQAGSGNYLSIVPGVDVYLQQPATVSGFASGIQHLEVPERPVVPEFTIDYESESTAESVCCSVLYSNQPDFSESLPGTDAPVGLIPGEDTYFLIPATESSFNSGIFHLTVPHRPVITSEYSSTTTSNPLVFTIDFGYPTSDIISEKLIIQNAVLQTMTGEYSLALVPMAEGLVSLMVEANAVNEGNFRSETYSVAYEEEDVNGLSLTLAPDVFLYPNPSSGLIHIKRNDGELQPMRILVYSNSGRVAFEQDYLGDQTVIDLRDLGAGIYTVRIVSQDREIALQKLVLTE